MNQKENETTHHHNLHTDTLQYKTFTYLTLINSINVLQKYE
jgi:hypothetical protein